MLAPNRHPFVFDLSTFLLIILLPVIQYMYQIEELFDNIIELPGRFRGSLDEMKDADTDKGGKDQQQEDEDADREKEEGVNSNDDNPFSY